MARIADKYGLTNKYRPVGSGKRNVRRGRPRKYLLGTPRRKTRRRTYYYKGTGRWNTNYVCSNVSSKSINIILISFFVVLLGVFSIAPIFRCLIPVIVGAGLLCFVEQYCKEVLGMPAGKWSKTVSVGWTLLTAFAMVCGLVLVLLVQIIELHWVVILAFTLLYAFFSFLILRKKYKKVKDEKSIGDTSIDTTLILK